MWTAITQSPAMVNICPGEGTELQKTLPALPLSSQDIWGRGAAWCLDEGDGSDLEESSEFTSRSQQRRAVQPPFSPQRSEWPQDWHARDREEVANMCPHPGHLLGHLGLTRNTAQGKPGRVLCATTAATVCAHAAMRLEFLEEEKSPYVLQLNNLRIKNEIKRKIMKYLITEHQ